MTTFNDERLAWRDIPVTEALGDTTMSFHLRRAGYTTLGKLLAATDEELADNVVSMGPKRATKIKRDAVKAAQKINSYVESERAKAELAAKRSRNLEIARAALARKRVQEREAAALARKRAQEREAAAQQQAESAVAQQAKSAVAQQAEPAVAAFDDWPDRIGTRTWVAEFGLALIALGAIGLVGYALGAAIALS